MKILFVYDHKYPELWKDGLWAALNLLEKDFEIQRFNLQTDDTKDFPDDHDFVLGWGGFNSRVDLALQSVKTIKKGLCIAGNAFPPIGMENYDVLFYETQWILKEYLGPYIVSHKGIKTELIHAFGVNTDIYKPIEDAVKIWDWVTVGAFAKWKRHYLLKNKGGYRLAIGEIQKENLSESIDIIGDLLLNGVSVSDMVESEVLAKIYNSAEKIFIPADINGGGERAVWEAKASGRPIVVEGDNLKLLELVDSPVKNHYYYSSQLKSGIISLI